MKKEYVVVRIDAAPDGGPYVLVTLAEPRDLKEAGQLRFGPQVMGFTSLEDMVKHLQKVFSGLALQLSGGMTTVIKMDMREYEDSGIKVGDRVYLELTKAADEGI